MKRSLGLLIATMFFAVPMLLGQNSDHVEVGAFVDSFRLNRDAARARNLGVGGRAGFNLNSSVQLL